MTDSPGPSEAELADRLVVLDGEIDRLRRKIWRVDKRMDPVPDREATLDDLQRQFQETSEEFVRAYQAWQKASREE